MPINVSCPSCSKSINAPDRFAGQRAKCPACGGAVDVPLLGAPPGPPPFAPVNDGFDEVVSAPLAAPAATPRLAPVARQTDDYVESITHELRQSLGRLTSIEGHTKRMAFWVTFWSVLSVVSFVVWVLSLLVLWWLASAQIAAQQRAEQEVFAATQAEALQARTEARLAMEREQARAEQLAKYETNDMKAAAFAALDDFVRAEPTTPADPFFPKHLDDNTFIDRVGAPEPPRWKITSYYAPEAGASSQSRTRYIGVVEWGGDRQWRKVSLDFLDQP